MSAFEQEWQRRLRVVMTNRLSAPIDPDAKVTWVTKDFQLVPAGPIKVVVETEWVDLEETTTLYLIAGGDRATVTCYDGKPGAFDRLMADVFAVPDAPAMETLRVADLYHSCSLQLRNFNRGGVAMSDCCGQHAISVVEYPDGRKMWRCRNHEGILDVRTGERGPIHTTIEREVEP